MTFTVSQRNKVVRQMSVTRSTFRTTLRYRRYEVAKGYKQKLFFGSFSRISDNIKIKKKTQKSQTKVKKNLRKIFTSSSK